MITATEYDEEDSSFANALDVNKFPLSRLPRASIVYIDI